VDKVHVELGWWLRISINVVHIWWVDLLIRTLILVVKECTSQSWLRKSIGLILFINILSLLLLLSCWVSNMRNSRSRWGISLLIKLLGIDCLRVLSLSMEKLGRLKMSILFINRSWMNIWIKLCQMISLLIME
jgi:hypothetical protein